MSQQSEHDVSRFDAWIDYRRMRFDRYVRRVYEGKAHPVIVMSRRVFARALWYQMRSWFSDAQN